jgi:hypothetical protein
MKTILVALHSHKRVLLPASLFFAWLSPYPFSFPFGLLSCYYLLAPSLVALVMPGPTGYRLKRLPRIIMAPGLVSFLVHSRAWW